MICSPVGPYYAGGFKPVALYGTTEYVRAFEGGESFREERRSISTPICPGTGGYKLGVNYAPGVVPQREAAAKGYAQNLWLHGPEHHLTEVSVGQLFVFPVAEELQVGTMNLFVVFRKKDGSEFLIF